MFVVANGEASVAGLGGDVPYGSPTYATKKGTGRQKLCHSPTLLIFFGDTIKSNCSRALSTEKYLVSRANQNVNLEEVGSFFTTKEERKMNGRVMFLATAKLVVLLLGLRGTYYKLNVGNIQHRRSLQCRHLRPTILPALFLPVGSALGWVNTVFVPWAITWGNKPRLAVAVVIGQAHSGNGWVGQEKSNWLSNVLSLIRT